MPESAKMTCRRSLNFEIGAREENSAGRENATAHLAKEIGVVVQETNVGLVQTHDLNTSTMQASNNYILISDESESEGTSPLRRSRLGAKPKEKPTAKRRYGRRKGLKNPTGVYRERMEVGEMDKKEPQVEVPQIPTTPAKPIRTEPAPIYVPEVQNQQSGHQHASEAVACFEFSAGVVAATDESVPAATLANIAGANGKTCVQGASDNVSSWSNIGFSELLFLAEAVSKNSGGMVPENNDGLKNPLIPPLNISKDNNSMKQALSSYMSLPEDTHAPTTSPAKSNPPMAKKNEKATGKRRYVRKKGMNKSSTPPSKMTAELTEPVMPESTKMAQRRSLNFDKDASDESSAGRQSLHVHNSKENSVVAEETHVGLAYIQSTPMKQALCSFMSSPEDKQTPCTSPLKGNHPGAKLNANSVEDKSKTNDQATAWGGHENSAKLLSKSVGRSNSNGRDISNSQTSMKKLQKRKHSGNIEPADTSGMNEIVEHYMNSPHSRQSSGIVCEERLQILRNFKALSEQFSQLDIN